jgi:hypothetical protein
MAKPLEMTVRIADMPQMLDLLDAMTDVGRAVLPYVDTDPNLRAALVYLEEKISAFERRGAESERILAESETFRNNMKEAAAAFVAGQEV